MILKSVNSIISTCLEKYKVRDEKYLKNLRRMIAKIKDVPYEEVFFSSEKMFLNENEISTFEEMLERYLKEEPISKIINRRAFWNHDFFVNADVLDPRPETELIVKMVLSNFNANTPLKILDVGTGSGCILLSLLSEFKNATGVGIDLSAEAIQISRYNQEKLNIKNASFLNLNWNDFSADQKFDIVVSNPPYIKTEDIQGLDKSVRNYDPILSLDGGASGLNAQAEISRLATRWLPIHGAIFLEIGHNQATDVQKILEYNGFRTNEVGMDLRGIERVIYATFEESPCE